MTKSRATLKGKGIDILLGGATDEPGVPVPKPIAAEPASPAAAARPNPFADSAPPAPSMAKPALRPNPFAEPAAPSASASTLPNPFGEPAAASSPGEAMSEPLGALGSDVAGGQPAEPVATSLPTEETPWGVDSPPSLPDTLPVDASVTADNGPVTVALPDDPTLLKTLSFGGLIMQMPTVPNPESFEPPTELTQTGLKVVSVSKTKQTLADDEVLRRIGPERIQALAKRIDELYAQVARATIAEAQAGKALIYLRQARDKELEDQRQYDEAEYLVNVAQYLITRAGNIRSDSRSYGIAVLIYGLLWLVVFGAGLFLELTGIVQQWLGRFIPAPAAVPIVSAFFATIMAGGIGGVLGVLYSLFKHIAVRQDFDRQFIMWYIVQPFLGILMGFIMHLFLVAGVFTLVNATGDAWRFLGLLVAVAAAFRQHYVFAWLERLLKAFDQGSSKVTGASDTLTATDLKPTALLVSETTPTAAPPPPSEPAGVG